MENAHYRNPWVWWSPGIIQFGADNETVSYALMLPKGKKGVVRDIMIHITEAMVGTTTVPEILVEATASALGAVVGTYARFRLGSTAILGYTTTPAVRRASSLVTSYNEVGAATRPGKQSVAYTEHVALEKAFIPADTAFLITLLAGSGGSETGAGQIAVEFDLV